MSLSVNDNQTELDSETSWQALEFKAQEFDGGQAQAINTIEAEQAPEIPEPSTSEFLTPLITLVTSVACPNWQIQQDEINQLAESYGALIDKYFPDGIANGYGVELSALMATGMIFAPRLSIPRHKAEEKPVNSEEEKAVNVVKATGADND